MKTFVVVICVVVALGSFAFFEISELRGFCDFAKSVSAELHSSVKHSKDWTNQLDELSNVWETKKNTMYMFTNHNNFKDIENEIFNIKFYLKYNENAKALYHTEKLLNKIDELCDICKFDLSNIL